VQLLAKRLVITDPAAAAFCRLMHASDLPEASCADFTLAVSSCMTYALPEPWLHGYKAPAYEGALGGEHAWDAGAAWYPWAEQRDPVRALHIDITWDLVPIQVYTSSVHARGRAPGPVAAVGVLSLQHSLVCHACLLAMRGKTLSGTLKYAAVSYLWPRREARLSGRLHGHHR
jgi:hypothetical protein